MSITCQSTVNQRQAVILKARKWVITVLASVMACTLISFPVVSLTVIVYGNIDTQCGCAATQTAKPEARTVPSVSLGAVIRLWH